MDWKTFIISILGSGAITALVNSLMTHKTQIKMIKESGLYVKRAEVLDELMKRMERLDRIMGELVSPFQFETKDEDEKARRKKAGDAFNLFISFYKRNRHYLPKELSNNINKLCNEYKSLFISFSYEARIEKEQPNIKKWQELIKRYENDFPQKREEIAEEFRRIIGVK